MTFHTSEYLLQRYAQDLEHTSKALFHRYAPSILNIACIRLPSNLRAKLDENDILQDTMMATFQAIEQNRIHWRKPADLRNYIFGIMQNKIAAAIEYFSAQKRRIQLETPVPANESLATEPLLSDPTEEMTTRLHDLCQNAPLFFSIVNLQQAGFSQAEIASQLNTSPRSIRRTMQTLRAKLIKSGVLYEMPELTTKSDTPIDFVKTRYSDFQLLKMIGMGSFAKVYLAREISTGNHFAFKAIRKKWLTNRTVRAAFINEAHKLQKIDDPNIVTTHGLGYMPNNGVFLVLDHVPGPTLHQAIQNAGVELRVAWMSQITETVERLHEAGITHRDLNAHNVIVQSEDQIKLVDFAFSQTIRNFKSEKNEDLQSLNQLRTLMKLTK